VKWKCKKKGSDLIGGGSGVSPFEKKKRKQGLIFSAGVKVVLARAGFFPKKSLLLPEWRKVGGPKK